MDSVAEIKARISIEDLVSQYIPLKKVGRNFRGSCPFHKERTPSFYVSPEKQMAYCFGCRKGGDHFKFIEEIEGLDFRGALKFLAEKTGVVLPKTMPVDYKKKTERDRLTELHEAATAFFENQLWDTKEGDKVLSYLKKRGLSKDTIKHARIGFAPESKEGKWNALYTHLLEKDYTREEIVSSGLAIVRDTEQSECIDRFRMRLMFPIKNLAGNICAFGGRALETGQEPKYLNSPETPIYHKSSQLYLLFDARPAIREKGNVLIVEGYMDALTVYQAGFKNVVACSGTALTQDQLNILKRFTKNIIFSFDRDSAGKMATERSIELGFDSEFLMKVVVWEGDAKDPDEAIKASVKTFEKALNDALPATSYLLKNFTDTHGKSSPESKRKVIENLLPFFVKIKSPLELDEWLKQCAEAVGLSLDALYDELKRFQGKQKPMAHLVPKEENFKKSFKTEEYLLGLLLTYPKTYSSANQLVKPEDFEDIELQNIYRSLTSEYNQVLDESAVSRRNLLAMFAESTMGEMTGEAAEQEVAQALKNLLLQKYSKEKRTIIGKLKDASASEKNSLLDSYQDLLAREDQLIRQITTYGKEV
jgi:DNA primase